MNCPTPFVYSGGRRISEGIKTLFLAVVNVRAIWTVLRSFSAARARIPGRPELDEDQGGSWMRQTALFVMFFLILPSPTLGAQEALQVGTTLPVTLTSSINSSRARPGERFTARVVQAVPVKPSLVIPAGAKILGEVAGAHPGGQTGSSLSLRFDRIVAKKHEIPVTAGLRAIASFMEVNDAQVPKTGPDEGTSSLNWKTVQVGGDVVYGAGGPVMAGATEVGRGIPGGVLAQPTAAPGLEWGEGWSSSSQLQSLWPLSSSACGASRFPNLVIRQSGRTPPVDESVLSPPRKVLKLPSGSGFLLQVIDDSQ